MDKNSDKAAFFIKTAIRVVLGALIVFVFIRNAFPDVKQAVVLDEADISVVKSTESTSSDNPEINRFSPAEPPESSSSSLPESNEIAAVSSVSEPAQPNTYKININTAPAGELVKLNGIGETKAAAIIKYRNEHGDFKSVDEIVNVSGIGAKTLENIRDFITI